MLVWFSSPPFLKKLSLLKLIYPLFDTDFNPVQNLIEQHAALEKAGASEEQLNSSSKKIKDCTNHFILDLDHQSKKQKEKI